jgi:lysophospholipase L1-like esterase
VVEDLLPRDHRAYLDGLHPSAAGFAAFARGFAAQVEPRLLGG